MTKQIPDNVLYNGQKFILAGLKGTGLFSPDAFGISSDMMGIMTACYRRFFCTYACISDELFLVKLTIVNREDVELPIIEGVSPKSVPPQSDIVIFNSYQDLKILCSFSGGLILVRNSVGLVGDFPSPIEFEEVIEVQFQEGKLQKEINHSLSVANLRKQVVELDESLQLNTELSDVLRKWNLKEKVSDPETKLFHEYLGKIVDKRVELEWSFVSDYEQQPAW